MTSLTPIRADTESAEHLCLDVRDLLVYRPP